MGLRNKISAGWQNVKSGRSTGRVIRDTATKGIGRTIFTFIISNPAVYGIVALLVIVWIVYVGYSFNYEMTSIMEQYVSIAGQRQDSKADFDKRERYLVTLADGTIVLSESYSNAMGYVDDEGYVDPDYDPDRPPADPPPITGDATTLVGVLSSADYQLNSHFKPNVNQYGYVYDQLIASGLPEEYAFGIIANISSEGTAGMRQGTYETITKSELQTIVNSCNAGNSNSIGVGLMQWTYRTYMPELLERYNNGDCWNGDTLDVNKALEVETAWVVEKALAHYTTASTLSQNSTMRYAEYWCDYVEKPGGWCAGEPKMRCVDGASNPGSACDTRVNRASKILTGMSQ